MNYMYHTARGEAVLNKGDDFKLTRIGKFSSEAKAVEACKAHYVKACKALKNLNKPIPSILFM